MNRKDFLAASATAAAVVPGGTHLVERHSDFDGQAFAQIVGRPAAIRQVVESVAFKPSTFGNVKNAFNGLQFGFGYPAGSIAVALAGHGPSAVYAYADPIWNKYRIGEFFKLSDAAGAPVVSNVFLQRRAPLDRRADPDDAAGMYQDASVEMLQQRGLIVLTCHTAVEEQARAIVSRGFAPAPMSAAEVAGDILTHLIPGAVVVPSMVAAIAVLQATYHYTYLTLAL
jgi:intracellular sulfur oxidation DsrE/DsrF family protein